MQERPFVLEEKYWTLTGSEATENFLGNQRLAKPLFRQPL